MWFGSRCSPGEQVSGGQTVLELETDKAVVEVPSTLSGTVREVKVQVGQKLKVGDLSLPLPICRARQPPAPETAQHENAAPRRCAVSLQALPQPKPLRP